MKGKATGKVRLAIARLAADHPYHASLLAQWRLVESISVKTMGIGFRQGRLTLVYSPDFVESVPTMDELVGVVHHEANHVIFGHCQKARIGTPDKDGKLTQQVLDDRAAMTVAEEITVNEWISEPLPGNPYLLDNYPLLTPNQDTETRYDQLRGTIHGVPEIIDCHETWGELLESPVLADTVINASMAAAWGTLSDKDRDKVHEAFKTTAINAGKKLGDSFSELNGGKASIPWNVALKRYVGRALCKRPVFGKPPRRFPQLAGIIPGKGRSPSKPHIMAVIDTSGSLDNRTLADISSELGAMSKCHKMTVVECDSKIHAVYPYRKIESVHGRGGTDLRPPFKADFLRKHRPDLIVYFTDGYGSAPSQPPRIPVIWCVTPNGKTPAAWGRVIHM